MGVISTILAFLSIQSAYANRPAPWPTDAWPRKHYSELGFDQQKFLRFVGQAFHSTPTFTTDSVVVIKDGYLVYEGYRNDFRPDQRHALFSLGKTIMNAVVGVLEFSGRMRRSDPLSVHYRTSKQATIANLLHMSSGIEWIEEDRENLLQSDPWFAFYSRESYQDMPAWVTKRAQGAVPRFNYSSGDSALLVAAIRGAVGERDYDSWFWRELFDKVGMRSAAIERDQSGYLGLHGISYASAQDVARLGLLYLRNGVINGQAIWPADWVRFTSQMAPSQRLRPTPNDRNLQNNQAYGAHIWLNVKRPFDHERPYPELPENAMLGLGTRGQVLLILPDQDLILVRMGTDSDLSVDARKNYRRAMFKALYESLDRP
jgi:CubicO group peptidase (beta-lactamase class C family)